MTNLSQSNLGTPAKRTVETFLSIPFHIVHSGFHATFSGMGDAVAVAILHALYGTESIDDLMVTKVLYVTQTAFAYPPQVPKESDRTPAVTLCLLEWLITKRPDRESEIRAAIQRIKEACEKSQASLTPATPPGPPQS